MWASLAVLALGFAAYMLWKTGGAGWMPGCVFRRVTGLECPGCGMTRATYALLHGDVKKAFGFNPVGMVLVPLGLIALGIEVIGWVRGKRLPFSLNPGRRGGMLLLAVMLVWWVVRNLI